MSEQFKVGDVCILQNCFLLPEMNGRECVVARSFGPCKAVTSGKVFLGYPIDLMVGSLPFIARPDQLRRKPPKADHSAWAASKVADLLKPAQVTA